MKKAYLIPLIISIAIGFFIGKTMCDEYHTTETSKTVFENLSSKTAYYLQYGVYSTKENMEKSVIALPYYIYRVEDNKYHVYIGVTLKETNVKKLQDYFQSIGYVTYKKEGTIKNKTYLEELQTFDEMLEKVTDNNTIRDINQKSLEKYKEE